MRDIAMSRPRLGYQRVLVMLKREGWQVGKTRVRRLSRLEGLQLRMCRIPEAHECLTRPGAAEVRSGGARCTTRLSVWFCRSGFNVSSGPSAQKTRWRQHENRHRRARQSLSFHDGQHP
ncbi:IS3 family transposase [Hydrogenophaga sp. NFH-34]|uniref:IS3 family transposase n=1 Tax=Hydrogenophaga sp. NFH-34 TaxID=2744446 RepID=UPI003FA37392